ncbi:MAG: VOC family protein [Terriglobales bacterium]
MPKRSLAEQLEQAVQAMLERPGDAPSAGDVELRELVEIAAELRDLPRPEFKQYLKDDLQRRAQMTTTVVTPMREGFGSLTPYLVVKGAAEVLEFARQAFGAQEMLRVKRPDGSIMHAEFRVGDSMLEIGEASEQFSPLPAAIHLKVEDTDAVYAKAVAAGGVSLYPPTDHEYGERGASVKDPGGNHWYIAAPLGETHFLPDQRSVTPYLHVAGAAGCIDFLKQAFGAQEVARDQTPDGIVHHAKMRLGDSVLEMGEAHGQYPAMPANLHLYVADTDATYKQALSAGATSMREPVDEPYGDRCGGVRDPFGNVWWIATHIRDVAT